MGIDAQKLTEILTHAGASAAKRSSIGSRPRWHGKALVRGRYKASLEVADTDVEAQLHLHQTGRERCEVGYEYDCVQSSFMVRRVPPTHPLKRASARPTRCAARFADCTDGITFARALNEVAVRDQVMKYSADLPQPSRDILDKTEVGHLTPPEQTAEGIQMFAVCGKRETKNDTPGRKEVRDEMFRKNSEPGQRYLSQGVASEAMIEYK